MSKRLIITLPDSVAKDLAKESKARQVSMSFILRDAYAEHRIHASLGRVAKHILACRPAQAAQIPEGR